MLRTNGFTQNEIKAFQKADAYYELEEWFRNEAKNAKLNGDKELAQEHKETAYEYMIQFNAMVETFNLLGLREKYNQWCYRTAIYETTK